MRVGYFSSGILGFESLIRLKIKPKIIFTDNKSLDLQQFAKSYNIPIYVGKPNTEQAEQLLNKVKLDLIISVNYIFILRENIFKFPTLGSINLHGSLLPKYRGRTPHVWAIINGEQVTGVTAHFIDEGCDTGDIIEQKKIDISITDSGQDLLEKYKSVYPTMIKTVIEKLEKGNFNRIVQDNSQASYYGKRTPKDGIINWHKKSDDIYNWVRAQSLPYPGAFSYYNKEKLIIDWVKTKEYEGNEAPGTILSTNPLMVKSGDGALIIEKIRDNKSLDFEINSVLQNEEI